MATTFAVLENGPFAGMVIRASPSDTIRLTTERGAQWRHTLNSLYPRTIALVDGTTYYFFRVSQEP